MNKLQWNFNQNAQCLVYENASKYIVCEMAAILSWGRWVKTWFYDSIASAATIWEKMISVTGSKTLNNGSPLYYLPYIREIHEGRQAQNNWTFPFSVFIFSFQIYLYRVKTFSTRPWGPCQAQWNKCQYQNKNKIRKLYNIYYNIYI